MKNLKIKKKKEKSYNKSNPTRSRARLRCREIGRVKKLSKMIGIKHCVYFIRFEGDEEHVIIGMTNNFPQRISAYKQEKSFMTTSARIPFVVLTMKPRLVETGLLRHFADQRCENRKEWFRVPLEEVRQFAETLCKDPANEATLRTFEDQAVDSIIPSARMAPAWNKDSKVEVNHDEAKMKKLSNKMKLRMKTIDDLATKNGGTLTVGKLLGAFKHYRTDKQFEEQDPTTMVNYIQKDFLYDVIHGNLLVSCLFMQD